MRGADARSPAPGKKTSVATTQNFVAGGVGSGSFFVPIVVTLLPTICQLLAYLTSPDAKALASSGATGLASACYAQGAASCASSALSAALTIAPTWEAARFLGVFGALAYALDVLLHPAVRCVLDDFAEQREEQRDDHHH